MRLAQELDCLQYLEVGARTGQGLESLQLDLLFEKYIRNEREMEVQQMQIPVIEKQTKKKKKRFFFF